MPRSVNPRVLHYTGSDEDRGGIIAAIRGLSTAGCFDCVLGVNRGFVQERVPKLETLELPRIAGETIGPLSAWRAYGVALAIRTWLQADPARIFHGHSRAGLLVALWLRLMGERRVAVSVHCYGRQRWFYRWAARRLWHRLFWLSPAMKRHYRVGDGTWDRCIPGCFSPDRGPVRIPVPRAPGRLILGGAGALTGWKRWDLILDALALLPESKRGLIEFQHIGDAAGAGDGLETKAALIFKTQALGLEAQVRWRGWEPSSGALLSQVDALVVCSENEPFSVAVMEALSHGVPVLAADSGGAVDLVSSGLNGWLFKSGDPTDLAKRLLDLLDNPAWSGIRVEPADIERCSPPEVARRWRQVYDQLLDGFL